MSLLKLADELLDSICRELSYEHPLPAEWLSEQLRITRGCGESAYHFCSHICASRILMNLQIFALLIQFVYNLLTDDHSMLDFGCSYHSGRDKIVCSLLPSFRRLAFVDLGSNACYISDDLFQSISALPTVSTVLVKEMATKFSGLSFSDFNGRYLDRHTITSKLDLSKVVLSCLYLCLSHLQQELLSNGMKVIAVNISDPEQLDEDFASRIFSGLCELTLLLHDQPVSFSWLPTFISAHPLLHEIRLSGPKQNSHVPPSIASFFDEVDRQGLQQQLEITSLYLSRAKAELQSVQQWHVTQVSLEAQSCRLIEILSLFSSSFSSIENLSLVLRGHEPGTYSFDNTIAAFSHFHFLQKLRLEHIFYCVEFGDELEYDRDSISDDMDDYDIRISTIKEGLMLCASRLAEAIASLEDVYFVESGNVFEDSEEGDGYRDHREWDLKGCLHVCGANRDITGNLEPNLSRVLGRVSGSCVVF
ncbi:hypothetical protein GYMLUDRAFT_82980 [Collybiopsis luxurians FD-317 M1]|nr:hypothetical protein GYMLUDRAFT_82980 [Collybiopsis luxurians FD-317 M1]